MGLLETLEELDLADDVKQRIRQEHESEATSSDEELAKLRAQSKRTTVDAEIEDLKRLGFSEAPGLLKFVRRVFLSDDEGTGLVLLSDADMELSGEDQVGAKSREEITVAGALRQFIESMPKSQEGKLALSDIANIDNDVDRPDNTDEVSAADKTKAARERLAAASGRPVVERTRSRYNRHLKPAGGAS